MAPDERSTVDADGGTDGTAGTGAAVTSPLGSEVPTPSAVCDDPDATGYVVWHRKHLRTDDHLALTRAVADGDVVCPLFVFDPSFYAADGLACDARIRFLHQAIASLDRLYATVPTRTVQYTATESRARLAEESRLSPQASTALPPGDDRTLARADSPGLTLAYGDPVAALARFVDAGWSVLTMATPTSRYGKRRDEAVKAACGTDVEFVSGDGLVRGQPWSRTDWQSNVETWLDDTLHTPAWSPDEVTLSSLETGVTPAAVEDAWGVEPAKTKVPAGTHRAGAKRLGAFVDRIRSYPQQISAPGDAREGTSGLSPYLTFGLYSIRQVYQSVTEQAPSCRGRDLFTDRLVWNLHYNQKLVDWPDWTDKAVNPVYEGFNEDHHDPDLVRAWKRGRTGFPMVDAAMRCLRGTGWLNFRMRAMAASFFAHILQQPWWIGADWYHHHLVDSDVGINYTQWQSQAGLIGKPAQRVYNPRKQVRDQDPDGDWITEWVPELRELPSEFLARPERTPLSVQDECGVVISEDYPRPVVDFEARRESFWSRYERHRPAAARMLGRPSIAKRASFSGGYEAAKAIAAEYGDDSQPDTKETQLSLGDIGDAEDETDSPEPSPEATGDAVADPPANGDSPLPTGTGERAGEPSPDDRVAAGASEGTDESSSETPPDAERPDDDDQTTIRGFD